jgi:hypothetical protein
MPESMLPRGAANGDRMMVAMFTCSVKIRCTICHQASVVNRFNYGTAIAIGTALLPAFDPRGYAGTRDELDSDVLSNW